jgi:alpha-D-ribose 1-methylphosphonate 5-triphosphate synthase subunit PhnL
MTPALRTEGLGKAFTLHLQGGTHIPVLGDVDLAVHPGECVALWGPSGAGKSTLMRCLYGNYGAGTGRILLRHRGQDLDLASADPRQVIEVRRETLGYVSQFLRVIPRVATRDIVAEPLMARGVAREEALARATALLRRLNLPDRLHGLPPATFSGGGTTAGEPCPRLRAVLPRAAAGRTHREPRRRQPRRGAGPDPRGQASRRRRHRHLP